MRPERVAALVARWVALYTLGLPGEAAGRRREEIAADVHDHIAHERAAGCSEGRIAAGVAGRMLRGMPADASWRLAASPSVRRVLLGTLLVLAIPAVLMLLDSDGADWGVFDFALAAAFLVTAGTLLELAARRPRRVAPRAGAVLVAIVAIVVGGGDDAPGLVLFGLVLLVGTVAVTLRATARR